MPSHHDLIPVLRTVSLFASLSEPVLAQVAADLQEIELEAGERVFSRGDPGDCMYIVGHGRVRIHDGDLVFTYREKGEFFGEMAALEEEVRSASVTAEERTHLFRLDRARLSSLINNYSDIAEAIISFLSHRLRDSTLNRVADFEYIRQVRQIISAAQALEAGTYSADLLNEVNQRTDALGQLAHVFQRMADEVQARERRLKQEVQTLKIEIDRVRQEQQVASITESSYFKMLQEKAQTLRGRAKPSDNLPPVDPGATGYDI
jgi:CRP-like cAMP-binding protein